MQTAGSGPEAQVRGGVPLAAPSTPVPEVGPLLPRKLLSRPKGPAANDRAWAAPWWGVQAGTGPAKTVLGLHPYLVSPDTARAA